jgi:hypothetical protein
VQADLGLPAPAIAANGVDGLQLWFSLAEPVEPPQALALLEHLRQRYMADLPLHRLAMLAPSSPTPVPRAVQPGGPWSAFVAADLVPVFEESPWLDLPPNEEGQADMLSRLASIRPAEWAAAWLRLQPGGPEARPSSTPPAAPATTPSTALPAAGTALHTGPAHAQAAQFLLQVMNDSTAGLALRVEAAKALLPYGPTPPNPAPP